MFRIALLAISVLTLSTSVDAGVCFGDAETANISSTDVISIERTDFGDSQEPSVDRQDKSFSFDNILRDQDGNVFAIKSPAPDTVRSRSALKIFGPKRVVKGSVVRFGILRPV